jgi:hypothetical protein
MIEIPAEKYCGLRKGNGLHLVNYLKPTGPRQLTITVLKAGF